MKPQVLPPNVLEHFYARRRPHRRAARPRARVRPHARGVGRRGQHDVRLRARAEPVRGRHARARRRSPPIRRPTSGPAHVARYGASTALLVKLLDAGQRLPVHFHPGRAFAREALGIAVRQDRGVAHRRGRARRRGVGGLHARGRARRGAGVDGRPGRRGDARRDARGPGRAPATRCFVPAGTPHAIGEGMLMVELQEPTDYLGPLEWEGFELSPDDCHLGLGWDRALQALDLRAWRRPLPARPLRAGCCPRTPTRTSGPSGMRRPAPTLDAGLLDPRRPRRQRHAGHRGRRRCRWRAARAVLVPYAAGSGELRGDVDRDPLPAAGARRGRRRVVSDALLVGLDVGTTAVKAAAFDHGGRELAHGRAPDAVARGPDRRRDRPRRAARRRRRGRAGGARGAPGRAGDRHRDRQHGRDRRAARRAAAAPVAPAIAWHDARGEAEAARLAADLARGSRPASGCRPAALCTLAKYRWMRDHLPESATRRALAQRGRVGRPRPRRRAGRRAVAGLADRLLRPARARPWDDGAGVGRRARRA